MKIVASDITDKDFQKVEIEILALLDEKARSLGLSRTEYVRQLIIRDVNEETYRRN